MKMRRTNYGIYGSWGYYTLLAVILVLSLLLIVFTNFLRVLLVITFVISASLLVLLMLIPQILYARRRTEFVPKVIAAGKIGPDSRVLDIGTGRGFLAIEIAKAVEGCRVVGIDVWDPPLAGKMHRGFVIGNTQKNAERNAQFEGVSDRVEFRRHDARKMLFESESFDVVVSSLAMHQIVYSEDGHRVLEEIYRVLKPNGRLIIVDITIGKKITAKIEKLGLKEIKIQDLRNLGPFSFLLKMLSAIK